SCARCGACASSSGRTARCWRCSSRRTGWIGWSRSTRTSCSSGSSPRARRADGSGGPSAGTSPPHGASIARRSPAPGGGGRDEPMTVHIESLTWDCADPASLASWWARALGWPSPYLWDDGDATLSAPEDGSGAVGIRRFDFLKVPEGKAAKNRLHVDL